MNDDDDELIGDMPSKPLWSDADRIKIKRALHGVKVEVTHHGNMHRKYRIHGPIYQANSVREEIDNKGRS